MRTQERVTTANATPSGNISRDRTTIRSFSPGSIIAGLLGAFLVFVGAVALVKTGISSDVTQPLTTVFGITQSAGVALIEVVAGLILIVSAFDIGSPFMAGVVGVFAIAFGLAAAVASTQLQHDFGFGQSTGWFFVVWGAIALLAALLPAISHREHHVDVIN